MERRLAHIGFANPSAPCRLRHEMRTLGNIVWHFPFLGFLNAMLTYLMGSLLTLTVLAAPIGLGLMEHGKFLFAPFSFAMVSKEQLRQTRSNSGWQVYSTFVMVLYLPIGLLLAVIAVVQIVALFCSLVGIPAAIVVAKSLGTYVNPVGKQCVPQAVADEIQRRDAVSQVRRHLR